MSRVYKSTRGKMVDMDKIKISNEDVVAVGNMKVNARGDLLGAGAQVVAGRNAIMDQVYAVESNETYSPNSPDVVAEIRATAESNKAKKLHDLANNLVAPASAEPSIEETAPSTTARGSLAGAVAKTTTVKQELIVDPRKPKGPSRI